MQVEYIYLEDDGRFPNSELPVIVYKSAWDLSFLFPASYIIRQLEKHNWVNAWRSEVYDYHHYHSTTHEVLAVYKGKSKLLLGGTNGKVVELKKGDVILIPAGVAHKNLEPKNEFKCVGAYPKGQDYDMNYGKQGERPATDIHIQHVPMPEFDPVLGTKGPVVEQWSKQECLVA